MVDTYTGPKPARTSTGTNDELTTFNAKMASGDYVDAAAYGRSIGYNDDQISQFVGAGNYNVGDANQVKGFLSANNDPINHKVGMAYTGPTLPKDYTNQATYNPTKPAPSAVDSFYDKFGRPTNDGFGPYTKAPTYNTDGSLGNMMATAETKLPANNPQQYDQINSWFKTNTQRPDSVSVDPRSTSAYQLQQMTAKDSPLMQQAANQGLLTAASRGLLNSSLSSGAAQAEMVKAAQPFALQDASTFNNQSLTNQSANNQFQLASYQKGMDTAAAQLLQNNQAQNLAAQSQIYAANTAQTNHLAALDQSALSAQDSAQNRVSNAEATYNKWLSDNSLQDSSINYKAWETQQNNSNDLAKTKLDIAGREAVSRLQADVQREQNRISEAQNNMTNFKDLNNLILGSENNISTSIKQIMTDPNYNGDAVDRIGTALMSTSGYISSTNIVRSKLGLPPITFQDVAQIDPRIMEQVFAQTPAYGAIKYA